MVVIGTAGGEPGRDLVRREGAHHVLDHGRADHLEEAIKTTRGRGIDVMLANVNLGSDLKALAPGGRVVVVGSRGPVEIDARDTMMRDASILGMSLYNCTGPEMAVLHSAIGAGLENGTLRPIVGRELPLSDAPAAHRAVLEPGSHGKIVLIP
jgi:NADPH2:quinone reductase